MRRVCPSVAKFRPHSYLLALHQARLKRSSSAPRRPPPRGQRAPFREQPRRFQPLSRDRRLAPPRQRQPQQRRNTARSAEEGESEEGNVFSSSESAATASEPAEPASSSTTPAPGNSSPAGSNISMPTSFLSVDQLYEHCSIAEEGARAAAPTTRVRLCTTALLIPRHPRSHSAGVKRPPQPLLARSKLYRNLP